MKMELWENMRLYVDFIMLDTIHEIWIRTKTELHVALFSYCLW